MTRTAPPVHEQYINPDAVYARKAFLARARQGDTSVRQARQRFGIELPTFLVGAQPFVRGRDGIEYLERLAEAQADAREGGNDD